MKLKYTKTQIFFEVIGVLILLGMIAFVVSKWNSLPQQIPAHYNAQGVVDRWGGKNEILFLPIVSAFLYVMLTAVSLFPKSWNMPAKVSEENRLEVYGCMKTMLILMKVEILGVFFYITYQMSMQKALSALFLPIFLVVLFGTIAYFIFRTAEKSK